MLPKITIPTVKSGLPKGNTNANTPNKKPFSEFQKYIAENELEARELAQRILAYSKLSICVSTGAGKSYFVSSTLIPMMLFCIKNGLIKSPNEKPIKLVYMTPLQEITKQAHTDFRKRLPTGTPFVTICGGEDEQGKPAFNKASNVEIKDTDLFISTYKQATELLYRLEKAGFDVICIVDESHELIRSSYQSNPSLLGMVNNCLKTFLFSATPETEIFKHYNYECIEFLRRETPVFNTIATINVPSKLLEITAINKAKELIEKGVNPLIKIDSKKKVKIIEKGLKKIGYGLKKAKKIECIYSGLSKSEIRKLKSLTSLNETGEIPDDVYIIIATKKLFTGLNIKSEGWELIYVPTKELGRCITDFTQSRHRTRYDKVTIHIICEKYEGSKSKARAIDFRQLEIEKKKAENEIREYCKMLKRIKELQADVAKNPAFKPVEHDYSLTDKAVLCATYCEVKETYVFDPAKFLSRQLSLIAKSTSNDEWLGMIKNLEGTNLTIIDFNEKDISKEQQAKAELAKLEIEQEAELVRGIVCEWIADDYDDSIKRYCLFDYVVSETKSDYVKGKIRPYIGQIKDEYGMSYLLSPDSSLNQVDRKVKRNIRDAAKFYLGENVNGLDITYRDLFSRNFGLLVNMVKDFFSLKNATGKRNSIECDPDFARMLVTGKGSREMNKLISSFKALRIKENPKEALNLLAIKLPTQKDGKNAINIKGLLVLYEAIESMLAKNNDGKIKAIELVNKMNDTLRLNGSQVTYDTRTAKAFLDSIYEVKTKQEKEGELKGKNVAYYEFSGLLNYYDVYHGALGVIPCDRYSEPKAITKKEVANV